MIRGVRLLLTAQASVVRYRTSLLVVDMICGEGQTERRACALFTEREVSFRVEASARTMTKESS